MPRFDNEGFNPNQRINNDHRDRSVPAGENYYENGESYPLSDAPVRDNQMQDINAYLNDFGAIAPPERSARQSENGFRPEVLRDSGEEIRERNRQPRPAQPKQKRKKRGTPKPKKVLRAILIIIILLLVLPVLLVNGVLGKINYDEPRDNQYVAASELKSSPLVKNILLLGVDARPNQESETSRADSMMLVSLDMKHGYIKMTSFLRDTWVYIPAKDGEQRLNAASSYDGYHGVVDTIEYNFGVDIEGYVVADFEMFKVLVDSIGGVEVDVTEKEAKEVTNHKKRYGNVKLEAGTHNLTGEQALAYCRIRKIDTDFVRTKRQRTVMQSIIKKAKHTNPFTLYNMARKSAPYIETDLSKRQLKRLAAVAGLCMRGDMVQTKVPFEHTWEYANKGGASVIAINTEKNKEQLIDFIYNKTAEEIKAQQE